MLFNFIRYKSGLKLSISFNFMSLNAVRECPIDYKSGILYDVALEVCTEWLYTETSVGQVGRGDTWKDLYYLTQMLAAPSKYLLIVA